MSTADAPEVRARLAARARWTPSPVVARSVEVVATRADELTDAQWAKLEAAKAGKADRDD
jgi:hypothetical protein